MTFFNMFRQPYLNADDGVNLGGGGQPPTEPTPTEPTPTPQGGTEPTEPEQMFKLKYNHEEKEIPYSQAVELAQKGMNYDKAIERASQEAKDNWIAQQGYTWNDKPITTEAEYNQALLEKAEYDRQQELINNNIDPEVVKKYIAEDPTVKQAKELLQQQEKQQKMLDDFNAFQAEYKDVDVNTIPPEVWEQVNKGKSLVDAYTKYDNARLKAELEAFKKGNTTIQTNQTNAKTATQGLETGNMPKDFISKTDFEANRNNQKWVSDNYELLKKSMNKWK